MSVPIPILVVVPIAIASFGTFCILRPGKIAESARRRYLRSSKFIQKWPFSNMVMKSWYPTYLRLIGLAGLILTFVWCYFAAVKFSK
jgi:hypothetical protein